MAKKIKRKQPAGESNQGRNRQERREQERSPQKSRSGKPLGMRIAIVVIMLIMALGILLMPLLSAIGK